jgi:hypothetical protein
VAVLCIVEVCCGGPTTPSGTTPTGSPSLVVRVLDDSTRLPITDSAFGIVVRLDGQATYSQPAIGGTASFPSLASGIYRLTTEYAYGYRQVDLVSLTVDRPQTFTLSLLPFDDLGVTEVLVDGQGSIPKGGTIDIPLEGVTVTFRGRYQLVSYTSPLRLTFRANFSAPSGNELGPLLGFAAGPLTATDWEVTRRGWIPCYVDYRPSSPTTTCLTVTDSIVLELYDPLGRAGAGTSIMGRHQPWPVTYRLASGCCKLPSF